MKIRFEKLGHSPKPFHIESDGAVFDGTLEKGSHHRAVLTGDIKGNIEVICNRCGAAFDQVVDIPLKLTVSDQIVNSKDDLDIIEFLDGIVDISFILQSEINTIKSDYHYCDDCSENDEELEIEF